MGKIKWTEEKLRDLVLGFQTKRDFKDAHPQAYGAIMDRGLGAIMFAHMTPIRKKWTIDSLRESTIGYDNIEDYKKENESAYTTICNRGLREALLGHIQRKHAVHTNESLAELAKKYSSRVEFSRKERSAYNTARNRGILDSICSHMERLVKAEWTDKELQFLADQCNSRQEFKNKYPVAHTISRQRKLLDIFFADKKKLVIPYTKEQVLEIAKKHDTRVDFLRNNGGAYNKALRDDFLDEACAHMGAAQRFRFDYPTDFYLLRISSAVHGNFIGYGITNDWKVRRSEHRLSLEKSGMKIESEEIFSLLDGYAAKKIEDQFKKKFKKLQIDVRGFRNENTSIENYSSAINLITSLIGVIDSE